jgi:predicted transcriptional regulator
MMHDAYDAVMRTTIDLPDDLHRIATAVARDRRTTLSRAVADLMRTGLGTGHEPKITTDPLTGLRVMSLGRIVTSEDVLSLEDEE